MLGPFKKEPQNKRLIWQVVTNDSRDRVSHARIKAWTKNHWKQNQRCDSYRYSFSTEAFFAHVRKVMWIDHGCACMYQRSASENISKTIVAHQPRRPIWRTAWTALSKRQTLHHARVSFEYRNCIVRWCYILTENKRVEELLDAYISSEWTSRDLSHVARNSYNLFN